MKHVSLTLTMLLLGAVPLTAAALDYGPSQALLAASGAPQLPGAQARAVASGGMPSPDAIVSGTDEAVAPAAANATRVHPSTAPGPSASRGPTASNPSHPSLPTPAGRVPAQPSWQSLLPGSIQ